MATQKQKKLAKKLSENIGKKETQTLGTLLRESGYSESVAESPQIALKGKGFQELLDHYLPEAEVTQKHAELLNASHLDHYVFPTDMPDEEIQSIVESVKGCRLIRISTSEQWKRAYFWIPDNKSVKEAIDMAYKLRGNYKPVQLDVRTFVGWTPTELEAYAKDGTVPERFRIEG